MTVEWVLRTGRVSAVLERRRVVRLVLLAVAIVALAFVTLCYGASWTTPADMIAGLRGSGPDAVIIQQWRLPRTEAAIMFGAALGVSGALLQNLTRNPLGSPDVIGLDAGAYTGTLIAMTMLSASASVATGSAVVGGLLAAAFVVLLSERAGLAGLRLVVTGIAVNAILTALNAWIVLRADEEVALAATGWNAGSLNGVSVDDLRAPTVILVLALVASALLAQVVQQTTLGDDLAQATGVRLRPIRLAMMATAVVCTATSTAVAGPIAFVALAAPQIGRRIVGGAGTTLLPAALTGAFLLLSADLLAQALLAPESLPVGVVTTCIGGAYLIWLLQMEVRRARRSQ